MKNFIKKNKLIIIRSLISISIIVVLILIGFFILKKFNLTSLTQEELKNYIESKGLLGPLIYIIIVFLQVTFIPLPGSLIIVTGSYVFGFWNSYLYSFIGMMLGSAVAFVLGRLIGKPFIYWLSGDKNKVDNYIHKLKGKENVLLFFMFLFPFFPDDLLCSLAGILPINFFGFMIMQIITRITSIGCILLIMSGEIIPYNGFGFFIIISLSILGIISFIFSYKNIDKINNYIMKVKQKIIKKNNRK